MGAVYRATDTSLGRQVAIKVLPDAFARDAERLARFEREAKTLASLNHPNIAAIYAIEKSTGQYALVMELVEGDDLSQRIAKGAMPIDEALPIAKQIAFVATSEGAPKLWVRPFDQMVATGSAGYRRHVLSALGAGRPGDRILRGQQAEAGQPGRRRVTGAGRRPCGSRRRVGPRRDDPFLAEHEQRAGPHPSLGWRAGRPHQA